jgi:site-specific recombinase XerD
MASVRYNLRSKKTGSSVIMGRLYYDGGEFVFSTRYSINPKNWNQKKNRVLPAERFYEDINKFLVDEESRVMELYGKLRREGAEISNSMLKRTFDGETETTTLYRHIENVIERRRSTGKKSRDGKDHRLYQYARSFKNIKDFASGQYGRELTFNDIDLNFYGKYLKWLRNFPYAESTVGREIKVLKRFLNLATVEGINKKLTYKSSDFRAVDKQVKHVYLTEDEVNSLFSMNLSGHLEKARDIFIIGCRTGLRVSDYGKCISDSVEKSGLICIDETEKTGEPVYIPIHWQVKDILGKYAGLPPVISDQKLNVYLKSLCRQAGITQTVKETRQGRNRPDGSGEFVPKCELVTTHTARRSCATNMYIAGFDLYFIQGILGHRDVKTTIRYLGITRKIIALQMVGNPYFSRT